MKFFWTILIVALFAFSSDVACAQQTTGQITGTVTDASGAVVPGATVTATNVATQQVRATSTNESGAYTIPYLTPGVYAVKAVKQGFASEENANLTLDVGADLRIDFKMQVGQVTQQVEVSTAAPQISTESTAVESTVEAQQITALPLNGRDYIQLVALNPNVVFEVNNNNGQGALNGTRAADMISISGQHLEYNHYTLDGMENTDPDTQSYIIRPSVDALQEFTVLTGIYSAEFGKGASQINATTLPGSNTYHGAVYDFLRNDDADAKIWTQPGPKNLFHREDYGFVLDGPLSIPRVVNGKDKLFFTTYFEDYSDHELVLEKSSQLTQDMMAGNFADGMAGEYNIYWPASQDWTAGQKGACQISSGGSYNASAHSCTIAGTKNVIPAGTISPIATNFFTHFPLPNYANNVPAASNEEISYTNDLWQEEPFVDNSTQFGARVDWNMNARSILFGRFSWEDDLYLPAVALGYINQDPVNSTEKQIVLGHTFTINPHMVNEARIGWSYFFNSIASVYANGPTDPAATEGIAGIKGPANGPADYGYSNINDGVSSLNGPSPTFLHDNIYSIMDSLAIIKGRHTFTVGGSVEDDQFNELGESFATGTISELGTATLNPANGSSAGSAAGGMGIATFELGLVDGVFERTGSLANVELRGKKYAAFLQDDWKVRPNLTLNLGMRYENSRPWIDKHDNFWNVDVAADGQDWGVATPGAAPYTEPISYIIGGAEGVGSAPGVNSSEPEPILTRPGAKGCNFYANAFLQFGEPGQPVQCGDQYMGRSTTNPNNENFGPRVGLNYALGTKTSIRTGFGIYYVQDANEIAFDMGRNIGGKDGNAAGTQDVYQQLASPWAAEAGNPACGPNQYNGNVAWNGICQLPGTAVAIGNEPAGTTGPEIQAINQNHRTAYVEQYMLNVQRQITKNVALEVGYTGNQSHHDEKLFLINQPIPRTGPTDTTNLPQRTPWEALGDIQTALDAASGVYNALDVKLTQRPSHGLLYTVAFTWGHSLDYASSYRPDGNDNINPSDSYWRAEEYGNSQYDQKFRFVSSFNYELPFGRGKLFAPSNPILNHIVSGWVGGGILTFESGNALNITNAGDPSDLGGQGTMPQNQNIFPLKSTHAGVTLQNPYWNPAAFACAYTAKPTTVTANPALDCTLPEGGYPNQSWQAGNWRRMQAFNPGLENVDANFGRTFHIWESHTLLVRLEAFNSTNHVNWGTPSSTNPSSSTFGVITTTSVPMRELQGAIKYTF